MRDPNRLQEIYDHIKKLHKEIYPDLRISYVLKDIFDWARFKNIDLFYMEDDKVIEMFDQYAKDRGATRGWYNRDPERLDAPYAYLQTMHQTYFPDWRFFQMVSNFAENYGWCCVDELDDAGMLYNAFNVFIKKVTNG